MPSLRKGREQRFIAARADDLAWSLAQDAASSAKEIVETLAGHLPPHVGVDSIFAFLFSMRATIESLGVRKEFGEDAYRLIVAAFDRLYRIEIPDAYANTGAFSESLMRDVAATTQLSPDPREWVRLHAIRFLGTNDPKDELFHLALAGGLVHGSPIATVVKANA